MISCQVYQNIVRLLTVIISLVFPSRLTPCYLGKLIKPIFVWSDWRKKLSCVLAQRFSLAHTSFDNTSILMPRPINCSVKEQNKTKPVETGFAGFGQKMKNAHLSS